MVKTSGTSSPKPENTKARRAQAKPAPRPKPEKAVASSARKLAPAHAPENALLRPSFMLNTNGGGSLESVFGFNAVKARSQGFHGGRVPPALRDDRLGVAGDIEFARPQFTFGADDRVVIGDPSALPWRCVCQLVVEGLHGREVLGTGWLAGPRTVITAGHNLLSHVDGHQAAKVWVMPARSGDAVPFGYDASTSFEVHPFWASHADRKCDVGVVWLTKPLGDKIGWFGMSAFGDAQLRDVLVNNAGYPADKPLGTQWFNAGRVLDVQAQTITYGLDTEPGQSGSPIFVFTPDQQRLVVAIHAYGDSADNIGVRINAGLFAQLSSWIR